MKVQVQDVESGQAVGTLEIPSEVLSAAHIVADWLGMQPESRRRCLSQLLLLPSLTGNRSLHDIDGVSIKPMF